jgi:hypothetical protein
MKYLESLGEGKRENVGGRERTVGKSIEREVKKQSAVTEREAMKKHNNIYCYFKKQLGIGNS